MDNPPSSVVSTYRPDIDGLRAIAVLGVVFFHVGIGQFAGGYVGVDIFLVISGYLISGILFAEYDRTGSISLRDFYYRRLKRITPALIATIGASTLLAVWLYSPALLRDYGQSAWMSALSISNIGFYLTSGYFDTDAHVKPLLHTWSLSVEEQFYAVWPLLLLMVSRFPRWRFLIVGGVALISLVAAELYFSFDRDAVFYLVPFRIFEFAFGALVHAFPNGGKPQLRWVNEGIAAISLVVMLICMLVFDADTPFPGIMAVIPCLATALFIWTTHTATARIVTGNACMVAIGRASYALYLVHWPVIVFYERIRTMQFFRFDEQTAWDIVAVLVISIVGALLLHICIEVPYRAPSANRRRFVVGTFAGLLGCIVIGGVLVTSDGWVRRPWIAGAQYEAPAYQNWLGKRLKPLAASCIVSGTQTCVPDNDGRTHGIVIGNSHVVDGHTIMQTVYPNHRLTIINTNGCGDINGRIKNTRRCADATNVRFSPAYLRQYQYVVLSNQNANTRDPNTLPYLDFLSKNGITNVVVLSNYMNSAVSFDDVVQMYGTNQEILSRFIFFPDRPHARMRDVAQSHGYLFIDKRALVCGTNVCPLTTPEGVPFSYDKHHLTYEYAQYMAGFLEPSITAYLGLR